MIKLNPRPALEALGISIMAQIFVGFVLFVMWGVLVFSVSGERSAQPTVSAITEQGR